MKKPAVDECTGGCGQRARGYDDRSEPTCGEWPCGTHIVRSRPVKVMKPHVTVYIGGMLLPDAPDTTH